MPTNNPYGRSGFSIENALAAINSNGGVVDPRLYNYGYTQQERSEGGPYISLVNENVNERGLVRRDGQEYAQVGEVQDRVKDPSKMFYDEEYGYLTTPDNINNPDSFLDKYMPAIMAAAAGGIGASYAGALGVEAGAGANWASGGGFGAGGISPEAAAGIGLEGSAGAGAGWEALGAGDGMTAPELAGNPWEVQIPPDMAPLDPSVPLNEMTFAPSPEIPNIGSPPGFGTRDIIRGVRTANSVRGLLGGGGPGGGSGAPGGGIMGGFGAPARIGDHKKIDDPYGLVASGWGPWKGLVQDDPRKKVEQALMKANDWSYQG